MLFRSLIPCEVCRPIVGDWHHHDGGGGLVQIGRRWICVIQGVKRNYLAIVHWLFLRWSFSFVLIVRSEEHTSELQSLMRISYAVFCLKKKNKDTQLHK